MEIEQKSGVQLMELEDDGVMLGHQEAVQVSENIVAPTEITLYALVGSTSSQTMRVNVTPQPNFIINLWVYIHVIVLSVWNFDFCDIIEHICSFNVMDITL